MSSPEDVKTEEPCSEVEETAVIKAEEPEVPEIGDHQDVKDVITASCSKISTREELEVMFADRYTEQCASFADIAKGFPASVVVHPWTSQAKRNYDYTNRGGGRGGGGGWRGGRGGGGGGGGGWRGGGGGYDRRRDGGGGYDRNRDGGGRGGGGYQGKRRWEDNNGHGGRGRDNPRVNYSGQH